MSPVDSQVARRVGQFTREIYSTARHNLGFYSSVAQTARYRVSRSLLADGDLESVVEHAISQTILAHPVLQTGITGEDTTSPSFVHLRSLNLSRHVRWDYLEPDSQADPDAALQCVLEARHSTMWPNLDRQPGFQFIVLAPKSSQASAAETLTINIAFTFHHAYGDGTSGVILQRTLFDALNNPIPVPSFNPSTHILTISTPTPLPPPQEALVKFNISWSFLFKTLWAEFGPAFLKPTPAAPAWTGNPISTNPGGTRLRLLSFPPAVSSGILARCREKSATLTPLLHILILRSLAVRLPHGAISSGTLTSCTPISLRRLLPKGGGKLGFDPDTSMGVILASQDHRFSTASIAQLRASPTDESLIWTLTASLGAEIRNKVASMPNDDITALMSWVSDYNAWFRAKLGKARDATWEVSNVGAADFGAPRGGEKKDTVWQVDRVVFSQSASVTGAALNASVGGVRGGQLVITLGWQPGIVDGELAEAVADDLETWLTGFATTGRFGFSA